MDNKDYYEVLGVSKDASRSDIKKAFRELSKKMHPDQGGTEEEFHLLKTAFETLYDPQKRDNYDTYGCDDTELQNIIRCAVDMFKKAMQFDPAKIMETIVKNNQDLYQEGENRISQIKDKIVSLEKQLGRIVKSPKNDFISQAINQEIKTLEFQIRSTEDRIKLFKDAEELLNDYIFDDREEEESEVLEAFNSALSGVNRGFYQPKNWNFNPTGETY